MVKESGLTFRFGSCVVHGLSLQEVMVLLEKYGLPSAPSHVRDCLINFEADLMDEVAAICKANTSQDALSMT